MDGSVCPLCANSELMHCTSGNLCWPNLSESRGGVGPGARVALWLPNGAGLHGERCNLARAVHRRERLSRYSFVIWRGKNHAAHHTWRLRQRPSATPVRFEMRASLQRRFFRSLLAFLYVAPHESGSGTKRTCRDGLLIVRFRGEADMDGRVASSPSVADDPKRTFPTKYKFVARCSRLMASSPRHRRSCQH